MTDRPGLAVVTGAARGIGAAVAVRLAEQGWSLLLIDACADQSGIEYAMPSPADLDAVAEQCRAAGSESVEVLQADVARRGLRARFSRAPSTAPTPPPRWPPPG